MDSKMLKHWRTRSLEEEMTRFVLQITCALSETRNQGCLTPAHAKRGQKCTVIPNSGKEHCDSRDKAKSSFVRLQNPPLLLSRALSSEYPEKTSHYIICTSPVRFKVFKMPFKLYQGQQLTAIFKCTGADVRLRSIVAFQEDTVLGGHFRDIITGTRFGAFAEPVRGKRGVSQRQGRPDELSSSDQSLLTTNSIRDYRTANRHLTRPPGMRMTSPEVGGRGDISSQLNTVSCRLSKTRDCFPTLAVRMYNCLPQHLKALESRDFECRFRKWFLANPLYSIRDFFENASNIA
ncbi:hypothetical protein J6590_067730 [Homalodisca vitripennis]|nr:hypothetical protein J6590_067730 [Homalodisca vitripennis]